MKSAILIVDDEWNLAMTIALAFRRRLPRHVGVDVCGSAEEAIEILSNRAFKLVVTDLRLPGKSGLDLLREISRCSPKTRKILISAYRNDAIQCQVDMYADRYLDKPFNISDFLACVEEVMGSHLN